MSDTLKAAIEWSRTGSPSAGMQLREWTGLQEGPEIARTALGGGTDEANR